MKNFKVGDLVKITQSYSDFYNEIGTILEVFGDNFIFKYKIEFKISKRNFNCGYFFEEEVEEVLE